MMQWPFSLRVSKDISTPGSRADVQRLSDETNGPDYHRAPNSSTSPEFVCVPRSAFENTSIRSAFLIRGLRPIFAVVSFMSLVGMSGCTSRIPLEVEAPVEFVPARPEEWKLPNGLTVMFLEDRELPLVRGALYLKGGSLWEDPAKFGTTAAMGAMLGGGGAGLLSADDFDRRLETLSAKMATSFGGEFGSIAFSGLARDFDEIFELFSDVVLRPRFEETRVALWRNQTLEGIRRRRDDPETIAGSSFVQLIYPEGPYGRSLLSSDVARIDRESLRAAHERFVRPDGAILTITGAVNRETLRLAVERAFGSWRPRGSDFGPPPSLRTEPTPGVVFVRMPFEQATVMMGHLGPKRLTPDFPAIEVLNEVFGGGGFTSELVKRVRTELGLAYVVVGGLVSGVERGRAFITLQTKSSSVAEAIEASVRTLHSLKAGDVDPRSLEEAKRGIANSTVFKFDSVDDLVQRRAFLRLLEFPESYDDTYLGKIGAVSARDVTEVARTRWDSSRFVLVVVGNEEARGALESLVARPDSVFYGRTITEASFRERLER